MKTILVNASAAKTGGAATVVRSFYNAIDEAADSRFVLVCGLSGLPKKKNVNVIPISTSGFWTFIFSTVLIGVLVLWFRPKRILSFNNLNYIFSKSNGISFFHQSKLFGKKYPQRKLLFYDWVIKIFLLKNFWVVQSRLVKEQLISKYPALNGRVTVAWPGFEIPKPSKHLPYIPEIVKGIFPVSSDSPHKNIGLFWQLHEVFETLDIHVVSLLGRYNSRDLPNYHHLEELPRDILFEIYQKMDFLLFTSLEETVGLPIFEFLQTGKPAFVYAAPYAEYYYQYFSRPKNLILFNSVEDFKVKFIDYRHTALSLEDYSKGEWPKVFELL
jgi:hypothetical protein